MYVQVIDDSLALSSLRERSMGICVSVSRCYSDDVPRASTLSIHRCQNSIARAVILILTIMHPCAVCSKYFLKCYVLGSEQPQKPPALSKQSVVVKTNYA